MLNPFPFAKSFHFQANQEPDTDARTRTSAARSQKHGRTRTSRTTTTTLSNRTWTSTSTATAPSWRSPVVCTKHCNLKLLETNCRYLFFQTAAFITDFHRWVSTRKKKKKEETAPGNSRPSSNAVSHEQVEVCVRTDKGRALVVGAPDRSDPPPVCDLRARKLERHKCPGVGENRLVSHQPAQVADAQHCDRRGGARELTIPLNCVERISGFIDLPHEPAAAAPVGHSGEAES